MGSWDLEEESGGGGGSGTVTGVSNVDGTITVSGTPSVAPVVSLSAAQAALTAGALQKANNLSDVTTKGTARENLRIPALAAVQCAAVANVNIASAPASVDGFSFVSSGLDTVLLTAQSTPSQNGPWVWNGAGSALTRPLDWSSGFVATTGRIVMVMNGTVNAGTFWYINVPSAGLTVDTTAQTWVPMVISGSAANEAIIRTETAVAPVVFTGSGTWTPSTTGLALFCADVIGGGGGGVNGGATQPGAGGGGGEVLLRVYLGNVTGAQTVTVGGGGAGGSSPANGTGTSIGSLVTAAPGRAGNTGLLAGYGGAGGDGSPGGTNQSTAGLLNGGGSGGGGAHAGLAGGQGGGGFSRYGGGAGGGGGLTGGGGSGGAQGGSSSTQNAGAGGVTGAGGGGGAAGTNPTAPTAGSGTTGGAGGIAAANTGGGGGGGGAGTVGGAGGAGGSGYVVIYQIA